jgi:hypothetical protein
MNELTMKTTTADSRMGSQSAASPTMGASEWMAMGEADVGGHPEGR